MLVLFGRGAFDLESVRLSSQSLAAYAVGLPAFVLVKVLAPAFFARGDTSMPVKIGMGSVALNLALNLAFMVPLAHIGPALATSVAAICNVAGLTFVLKRRRHFVADRQLRRRCIAMAGASVAMAGLLWGLRKVLFHGAAARMGRGCVACGTGWRRHAGYAVAATLSGAYDLRDIGRMMSRRRLRLAGGSAISSASTTET